MKPELTETTVRAGKDLQLHRLGLESPVLLFVSTLAFHSRSGPKGRIADAFCEAIHAAIRGLAWRAEDWSLLVRRYGGQVRPLFGDCVPIGSASESWYTAMVKAENAGACASYERHADRPPYLHPETGERLYVGSTFTWEGLSVSVTSFHPRSEKYPHGYLVAMTAGRVPRRRFTLTLGPTGSGRAVHLVNTKGGPS